MDCSGLFKIETGEGLVTSKLGSGLLKQKSSPAKG